METSQKQSETVYVFDEYNSSFVFVSMTKSLDFWNAVFDDDPSLALLLEVNDFEREASREAELRNLVEASALEPSLIENDSALEKVKWKMPQDLCRQSHARKDPKNSIWWIEFLEDNWGIYKNAAPDSYKGKQFRHKFRMTWWALNKFLDTCKRERWFAEREFDEEETDGRRKRKVPVELLIMGSLAFLGGSISFENLPEVTNISSQTHRAFFDEFTDIGATKMYALWIKIPSTTEELADLCRPYNAAGLPGAFCSIDGVRVRWWSCSYGLYNENVGKESYPVRTFEMAVAYDGRILHCTRSWNGRDPDMKISKEDPFIQQLCTDPLFTTYPWTCRGPDGEEHEETGLWALVDNGYPPLLQLHCPIKFPGTAEDLSWSEMIESLRKDVERTFGIIKQRFRILKLGMTIHRQIRFERIFLTCCAIHNFLHSLNDRVLIFQGADEQGNIFDRVYHPLRSPLEPMGQKRIRRFRTQTATYEDRRTKLILHFNSLLKRNEIFWPNFRKAGFIQSALEAFSESESHGDDGD